MDIKVEKDLVHSCAHALQLQYEKETIQIEKEWLGGLIDRLNQTLQDNG